MSRTEPTDLERKRAEVLRIFSEAAEPATVRWTDARTSEGDFDGRERSIEVFNVPASQQRNLHRQLKDVRRRAAEILGGPVVVLFHSPEATRRHYQGVLRPAGQITGSTFISAFALRVKSGDLAGTFQTQIDSPPTIVLHRAA
jgi:hypothetical protein